MMDSKINLDIFNKCTLALVQALLGAVSQNFRMVTLEISGDAWKIQFVLEHESDSDREEIEDVAAEFEALQESAICYEIETIVKADALAWPAPPARVVFRRKEE